MFGKDVPIQGLALRQWFWEILTETSACVVRVRVATGDRGRVATSLSQAMTRGETKNLILVFFYLAEILT